MADLGAVRGERPGAVALVHGGRRMSYGEMEREVARLARGLRDRFEPGALIGVSLPTGPEILCVLLACFRAGVVPMPMHRGLKPPEVRAILDHARPRAVISEAELDDLRSDEGIARGPSLPADAPALVLLTSGSKGLPKGVVLSRGAIDHILQYRLAHTELSATSLAPMGSCLTQSVGLYQSLAMLAAGGTLVLLDSYDPDGLADAVHRHRPTHLILVVDAMDRLLHHPTITAESLRSLVFASVGADRVTARVQDRFVALTGRALRVSYGLTESSWALVNPGDRLEKRLALGRPCPGIEVAVRDRDGRPVPDGAVGEIFVHSPRTMLGYLHDEARTSEALVDGWLATGDLGWRDDDGWYWFAGRRDDTIVLATGDKVAPYEIEQALAGHPAVSRCAVVGARVDGSRVPWAYVTLRAEASEADLDTFLRDRLSDYKVPRRFVFLDALPVGLTGKVRGDEARG